MNILKKRIPVIPEGWTDCDIPARLFYKIIENSDYSLVGGDPIKYEDNFYKIFDEYFRLSDNSRLESAYRKSDKIRLIKLQMQVIEDTLYVIAFTPGMTEEQRMAVIKVINGIDGVRVNFNMKADPTIEIRRVQTSVLGMLANKLAIEESTQKQKTDTAVMTFERQVVNIENVLGRSIDENTSLRKYIEYEKSAKEKAAAAKQNQVKPIKKRR